MSAVSVLKVVNDELILDEEGLKDIILHTNGYNKNVAVISITGALRKGKTTLLNFIKCYLEEEWNVCKNYNKKLDGFLAVKGSQPVTEGIMMWSEPIIKSFNGEEVAIYLMDTEGAHELGSNQSSSAAIFALTSLVSSVQLFNAKDGVDQRDFELLVQIGRFAAEVSKASLPNTSRQKSFQKLAIIIRDWISPLDVPYGRASLQLVLSNTSRQSTSHEWLSINRELEKFYNEINCHLLPFPGEKIAFCLDDNKSDFYFNEFKEDFIDQTKLLLDELLSDNIIKEFKMQKINNFDLFNHFIVYYKVFKNGLVVAPDSILKATANICYDKAFDLAFMHYKLKIKNFVERSGDSITVVQLNEKINETLVETLIIFENNATIVQIDLQAHFLLKLSLSIQDNNQETLKIVEYVLKVQRLKKLALAGAAVGAVGVSYAIGRIYIPNETYNDLTVRIVDGASTFAMAELTRILNNLRG